MKVGVCCHDAGAAEIISSYIKQKNISPLYYLSGPAIKVFERKIGCIDNIFMLDIVNKSEWLLCGTSWKSDLEWNIIKEAKKQQKKVIVFLDHWINYRERFIRNNEEYLPDEIWVGDHYAEKIAKEIFSNLKIKLIENPYLLDIKKQLLKLGKNRVESNSVLYVCEPISELAYFQHGDEHYWGYTEEEALRYFLTSIDEIFKARLVIIRPHPSEDLDKYDWIFDEFNHKDIKIDNKKTLLEQILESDIVVGCESMAMVVAILAEKEVISSIPPGGRSCVLPYKEIKIIEDYL
jgi:hypothetical protein